MATLSVSLSSRADSWDFIICRSFSLQKIKSRVFSTKQLGLFKTDIKFMLNLVSYKIFKTLRIYFALIFLSTTLNLLRFVCKKRKTTKVSFFMEGLEVVT